MAGKDGKATNRFTWQAGAAVVVLLAIMSYVAWSTYTFEPHPPGRMVHREATSSLLGLRAFETFWWHRTGGFIYSSSPADRVEWERASLSSCDRRVTTSSFQITLADPAVGWTPQGCQWEYFVLHDRCAKDCSDVGAGNPCADTGSCFCVIAELRASVGEAQAGERICMDDVGGPFANVRGIHRWD